MVRGKPPGSRGSSAKEATGEPGKPFCGWASMCFASPEIEEPGVDLAPETALPLRSAPPPGSSLPSGRKQKNPPCRMGASESSSAVTPSGGFRLLGWRPLGNPQTSVQQASQKSLPGSPHPDKLNSDADRPVTKATSRTRPGNKPRGGTSGSCFAEVTSTRLDRQQESIACCRS